MSGSSKAGIQQDPSWKEWGIVLKEPALCEVDHEDKKNFYGHWSDYYKPYHYSRFPKLAVRELTPEEVTFHHGRKVIESETKRLMKIIIIFRAEPIEKWRMFPSTMYKMTLYSYRVEYEGGIPVSWSENRQNTLLDQLCSVTAQDQNNYYGQLGVGSKGSILAFPKVGTRDLGPMEVRDLRWQRVKAVARKAYDRFGNKIHRSS